MDPFLEMMERNGVTVRIFCAVPNCNEEAQGQLQVVTKDGTEYELPICQAHGEEYGGLDNETVT